MKTCARCGFEFPLALFALKDVKTGRRHSYCKPCHSDYRKEHCGRNRQKYIDKAALWKGQRLLENRELLWSYLLQHPCVDCGECDGEVLEFDHRDASLKSFSIADAIASKNWTAILSEIEKCDVRCRNCHRRRTNRQFGHWRFATVGQLEDHLPSKQA